MEKIVDNVAEAVGKDSVNFKEEFAKAQQKMFGKFPTPESFASLIDSLKDMTEEQKEKLKRNLADRAMHADKFKEMFKGRQTAKAIEVIGYKDYYVFFTMFLLIVLVIGESYHV
jgi:hypothetical protein